MYEDYFNKQVEASDKDKNLYEDAVKVMKTEERYINFFKNYNAQSVEGFINYFATMKGIWYKNAESNFNYSSKKRNMWRSQSVELLKMIYRKKLFDIKCRWVAGEIDLEGIEISSDINVLSDFPERCTFLEPITHEELHCLLNYLEWKKSNQLKEINDEDEDDDYEDEDYISSQYYHEHKALCVDGYEKMIPAWFRFYDKRFKTETLLNLPVIRTEMEIDLYDIWAEEIHLPTTSEEYRKNHVPYTRLIRIEYEANPEKKKVYEEERQKRYEEADKNRPKYEHYHSSGEFLKKVVNEIETFEMKEKYEAYTKWHRRKGGNEQIEMDVIHLGEIKEFVSIESADDYKDAIEKVFADYSDKKVMETLPFVFDEYRKCIDKKKTFDWDTDSYKSLYSGENEMKRRMLEVLKFKGLPENFDFMKKDNLPKQ